MTRATAGRAAALLGLLLAAPPARADYRETYRKAVEAVDRKRWPEVARLMREAIAENPREGERVKLYGLRFEAYVPHFYLGLALLNTGDCDGAVKAFDASEAAGAIRGTPRYAELLDGRKACAGRMARVASPPAATPKPPPAPPAIQAPAPSAEPVKTAEALPPSPPAREEAPPRTAPSAAPPPAPSPSPADRLTAPPADLMKAARAYFDGRYEESLALLSRLAGLRGRAAAQSHLFRAAARFALYRVGRQADASLRSQAAQDVVACRRADASLAPDPQAFSPAFAEFFRRSR
jgi:hypothetical protein